VCGLISNVGLAQRTRKIDIVIASCWSNAKRFVLFFLHFANSSFALSLAGRTDDGASQVAFINSVLMDMLALILGLLCWAACGNIEVGVAPSLWLVFAFIDPARHAICFSDSCSGKRNAMRWLKFCCVYKCSLVGRLQSVGYWSPWSEPAGIYDQSCCLFFRYVCFVCF